VSSKRKRVLIVDVDPALLGVVERLLETEGWDTTTTWDMNEAIASLRSRRFDLVIAGHHPPDIKAEEILKQLQTKPPPASCIVTVAAVGYPFEAQYLRFLGAKAIVSKWNQHELVEAVRRAELKADG
jgi:CheY-like chemotaxis protein